MELKPCPFCGSKANLVTRQYRLPNGEPDHMYRVTCTNRRCSSMGNEWYPASAAMAAWNRRTPPDTPSGEE